MSPSSITRQTLKTIPAGGQYSGAVTSIYSGCANANNNGPLTYFANLVVAQNAMGRCSSTGRASSNGNPFTFVMGGPFVQQGLLYQMPGAAYVAGSNNLTANVSEIKVTVARHRGDLECRTSTRSYAGCVETAYFSLLFITP